MNAIFAAINPEVIFTAGLLLVVWFAWRWSRKRAGGRTRDGRFVAGAKADAAEDHPKIPPASLGPWEVGMHDVARDLSAQLDTKIRIVQQLVWRAEQQTARLEAVLDRAERLQEVDAISRVAGARPASDDSAAAAGCQNRDFSKRPGD